MVPRLSRRAGRVAAAAVATLAAVAVLLVSHEAFAHHSINHDEGVYLQQAAMLLEGELFLAPPVEGAFRPWFFVESERGLYSKYAPVPAAVFALGKLAGGYRLALAGVAAGIVALTYATVTEAFDREHGVLAAALLAASPLFLVDAATFLPYAPTLLFELLFAWAYLRGDRTGDLRWGLLAGLGIAVAFFARPYTAVLFAAPFVGHALWTLPCRPRTALARQGATAAVGSLGVVAALGYNAAVTGDPLVFPFEAFAPRDGLGFGERAILDHERTYSPGVALAANARVVWALFSRWVVAGPLGTLLAAVGLVGLLGALGVGDRLRAYAPGPVRADGSGDSRNPRDSRSGRASRGSWLSRVRSRARECTRGDNTGTLAPHDAADTLAPHDALLARRVALAGLFVSVVAGNVYFWGNLNVLGDLGTAGDGLIRYLGPYYHFDLLVPTAAFAAHGALALAGRWRAFVAARDLPPRADGAGIALGVLLVATATVGAAAVPVAENDANGDQLETAYEPLEPPPDDAVVFLPTPYGDWLNHPFQATRNNPGFDGSTVYTLPTRPFAVVDAYPDREHYRYVYRGEWAPFLGDPVEPRLQPVEAVRGEQVRTRTTLGVPSDADRVSIRVATDGETAYYAVRGDPERLSFDVVADADGVGLAGDRVVPIEGNGTVPLPDRGTVTVEAFVDYGAGSGFSYRTAMPVAHEDGGVRALTPSLEVCSEARLCGGEAAYVPSASEAGVFVRTEFSTETDTGGRTEADAWS